MNQQCRPEDSLDCVGAKNNNIIGLVILIKNINTETIGSVEENMELIKFTKSEDVQFG